MLLVKRFESIANFVRVSALGVNCLFVVTTYVKAQAIPESLGRDDRIGVCTHFAQNWSVAQIMPLIAKSGAGWIRDDFDWVGMGPPPGNYRSRPSARVWLREARMPASRVTLTVS